MSVLQSGSAGLLGGEVVAWAIEVELETVKIRERGVGWGEKGAVRPLGGWFPGRRLMSLVGLWVSREPFYVQFN